MDWTSIICSLISSGVVLIGYILVDKREKNKQLDAFKTEIVKTLSDHRKEYLDGIEEVKDNITEIKAVYQQNTAIVELKIEALEKAQTHHLDELKREQQKHNNLISRMYEVEAKQAVQEEMIRVANHRISDLEGKKS